MVEVLSMARKGNRMMLLVGKDTAGFSLVFSLFALNN